MSVSRKATREDATEQETSALASEAVEGVERGAESGVGDDRCQWRGLCCGRETTAETLPPFPRPTSDTTDKGLCHGPRIPARVVLGIVSFFGFFTNYMLRVNINIAIVAMVKGGGRNTSVESVFTNFTSEDVNGDDEICFRSVNYDYNDTNSSTLRFINSTDIQDNKETFDWDSVEQGIVLGAFYWSYVLSLVPGAMLARQFGAKLVFGVANGFTALLALVTPIAVRRSFSFLIAIRVFQGFASGTTWPAMHTMASQWIPPHERSKFISTYLGNAVGIAVTYPLCGVLIDHYGWPAAFYVPALIGFVWCFIWWLLIFDSPNLHPRITREEKVYIENAVSPTLNSRKMAVPWLEIAKSKPFWALVVANLGSLWGFMTVLTYGPTYFKSVHGFNIQANGMLSGLPNVMRFIAAVVISYITDRLIQAKVFSFTIIRKVATLTAEMLPGLLYLMMTNVGCNATAEVAILTVAAALSGATTAGPLANMVDLAPNFAGIMMGLVSLISMSSGFLVPSIVGAIINNNNSRGRWRLVFIIGGVISIACSLVYSVFGSGEVQPWNGGTSEEQKEDVEKECQGLRDDSPSLSNGSSRKSRKV